MWFAYLTLHSRSLWVPACAGTTNERHLVKGFETFHCRDVMAVKKTVSFRMSRQASRA
jgi:hypothetical protein